MCTTVACNNIDGSVNVPLIASTAKQRFCINRHTHTLSGAHMRILISTLQWHYLQHAHGQRMINCRWLPTVEPIPGRAGHASTSYIYVCVCIVGIAVGFTFAHSCNKSYWVMQRYCSINGGKGTSPTRLIARLTASRWVGNLRKQCNNAKAISAAPSQ